MPITHDLLAFDIRPVLDLIDLGHIKACALKRYQAENNINPDYAMIIKSGSPTDQKLLAIEAQVIDDFIITAINSFEHTWIQRNLSHITPLEYASYKENTDAWQALYKCVSFNPEHAGVFGHYQRIAETIFIAVPKY